MIDERKVKILELLAEQKRIDVNDLADLLGVSAVTIRKDLTYLEEQGVVEREHGAARLKNGYNYATRVAYHYKNKLAIANRAAQLVEDGDTVMIELGSCCILLAEQLFQTKNNITIITNSLFLPRYVVPSNGCHLVVLGGEYMPEYEAAVGPMVRQGVENYWVKHLFIGVDGYSEKTGFTKQVQQHGQAVRDMAHQADRVVILTESEKFAHHGVVPLNLQGSATTVVTDSMITPQQILELRQNRIEVLCAP